MNTPWLIAAGLALFAAAIRTVASFALFSLVEESNLSIDVVAYHHIMWHAVSAVILVGAVAFFLIARGHARRASNQVALLLTAIFFSFCALVVYYGVTMDWSAGNTLAASVSGLVGVFSLLGIASNSRHLGG